MSSAAPAREAGARTSSRPLRTLVVSSFGVLGGAERYLLSMLDATSRLDATAVLLGSGPLESELRQRGVPVRIAETGKRPADVARAAARLARELRRSDVEAVWANGVKAAAVAVPAARLAGVPVVWVKHDRSFDGRLAGPLGRLADRVVAVSPDIAAPTGRADAVVVPPPRPEKPAGRAAARRFWGGRGLELDDRPTLAMASRLLPYKGVDDAIAALAAASDWRLVVIGADDYAAPGETERLREIAARHGADVAFAGEVPDAGRWLAAFDAVAVLSKTDERGFGGEGAPLAALEAMAAGVPVVVTGPRWLADDVASAGAGAVVEPGRPDAVASALAGLAEATARRRAGRAARALSAAHPDAATCADLLAGVLSEAAARPGAGLADGPAITVVTTVLNEGEAVDRLLDRLQLQLRGDDELVVVDGGSRDDTAERVRRRAAADDRITLLEAPGTNIPAGRNAGIAAARNAVVACTDAGCDPEPGWLDALRAGFANRPSPALVTGVYRVTARSTFEHAMAVACYPVPEEARRAGPLVRAYGALLGRNFDPTMPTGRSSAFTVEAWREAGGFPEHLATGEDVTFGRAIARTGGRCVLAADAEVGWHQRPTLKATARMYFAYGKGGAESRDRKLIARDLARLVAYAAGAALVLKGGRTGKALAAAGAAAYLSLPVLRARKRPRPAAVAALTPFALALKDLSKVAGCLRGLAGRAGSA